MQVNLPGCQNGGTIKRWADKMQKFKETVAPEVWNSSVEDAWSEWEAL
tara:strand:+ start:515 stop:658 length:144 start_codon:yes stop_codon:yes gene_type:complete